MPKISVIVPVYNVEKYLPRCIDSILAQTFTDFELILVDDGSPDNCGKICDEYASKDSRIKVIHKENGGLSDARNVGIDTSIGECLTFIDSDDWVGKDYLLTMYQNMIECNADISAVNLHKEYDDDSDRSCDIQEGLYSGIDCLKFLYENETSIYANVAWAKLYKRELFEEIKYPVGKVHEDGYTTYKLYYIAKKVYFSKSDLYFYYQRKDSIMNEKFSLNRVHEYYVYKERADFFTEKNLKELFLSNEKTKLACIFSLTIKINDGNFSKKEKAKWFKIFREDIKKSRSYVMQGASKKQKLSIKFYVISAECYCLFHRLINLYRKLKKRKKTRKIFKQLKNNIRYAKLLHNKEYAFLCMTPTGGNLGDHALACATKQMLSKLHLVELPCVNFPYYFSDLKKFKKAIGNETLFFMPGGNLGTLWYDAMELYLRKTIQEFPNNNIVVLPNTVYYENDLWGQKEFDKSLRIYNNHQKLTVFVREEVSFDLTKKQYKNVFLKPDLVMMLNFKLESKKDRNGCLLCLRKDVEKAMEQLEFDEILSALKSRFEKLTITDTVVPRSVKMKDRKKEILAKLQEFREAQLVVTDRLHGMIFAAITETPCIVIQSKSHKIKGCYKWLENLDYIKLVDNLDDLIAQLDQIQIDKEYVYDNSKLKKYYDSLSQECYNLAKGKR